MFLLKTLKFRIYKKSFCVLKSQFHLKVLGSNNLSSEVEKKNKYYLVKPIRINHLTNAVKNNLYFYSQIGLCIKIIKRIENNNKKSYFSHYNQLIYTDKCLY